jgi:hypothetical protein
MSALTSITVNFGSSSSFTVAISSIAVSYSQFVQNIVTGGGIWNGTTWIPLSQITSIVVQ